MNGDVTSVLLFKYPDFIIGKKGFYQRLSWQFNK